MIANPVLASDDRSAALRLEREPLAIDDILIPASAQALLDADQSGGGGAPAAAVDMRKRSTGPDSFSMPRRRASSAPRSWKRSPG